MARPAFGVYVHYPYCARHCPYCDFAVTVTRRIPHAAYRHAVLAEMEARSSDFVGRAAPLSVYFGGGTPGLWPAAHIGAVIDGVRARFGLADDAEVTVEVNPEDVTVAGIVELAAVGVNRISMGVQSFDDALLRGLGRQHTGAEALAAIAAIGEAGIDRINVDLMHGAAEQTLVEAVLDVERACAAGATHVSTYQLTIEDRTAFGARARRGETLLVDEDRLVAMYDAVQSALRSRGLLPYEVSNAARPGHEARHNSLYWTDAEYLALGVGAHGYVHRGDGAERWANLRHADRYIAAALAGRSVEAERTAIEPGERLEDRVMCGLRLFRGVAVDDDLERRFGAAAGRLAESGLLAIEAGRWRATSAGRALLDRVVLELVSG